jgi:hypothetical protein
LKNPVFTEGLRVKKPSNHGGFFKRTYTVVTVHIGVKPTSS